MSLIDNRDKIKHQTIENSNRILIEAFKTGHPFVVIKPNLAPSSYVPFLVNFKQKLSLKEINLLQKESGIYFRTNNMSHADDIKEFKTYIKYVNELYDKSTFIGCFNTMAEIKEIYERFNPIQRLAIRSLSPTIDGTLNPWIEYLDKKTVLIVSNFARQIFQFIQKVKGMNISSLKHRYLQIIHNNPWFSYSGYDSFNDKKPHTSWYETFQHLCRDVDKMLKRQNYDVVLISLRGYSLPLCHYLYHEKKKIVFHLGPSITDWFSLD